MVCHHNDAHKGQSVPVAPRVPAVSAEVLETCTVASYHLPAGAGLPDKPTRPPVSIMLKEFCQNGL